MQTRKTTGQPVHIMAQGKPVSGRKAIGEKQAKSKATRTKPPTLKPAPWASKEPQSHH